MAYRTNHSTETAVLKVLSDMSALVLLDLAAYDTADHGIILQRLDSFYKVVGTVLKWCQSYLSSRLLFFVSKQAPWYVAYPGFHLWRYTVPPVLWWPAADYRAMVCVLIFTPTTLKSMVPVDHQPSLNWRRVSKRALMKSPGGCARTVYSETRRRQRSYGWIRLNRRILQLQRDPTKTLRVSADSVVLSTIVRDLWILIDSDVSMRSYVTRSVSTCFLVLCQLRTIRRSVSRSVIQSLVTSFVLSRRDYRNATLADIPKIFFCGSSLLWMQQHNSSTRHLGVASLRFYVNSTCWKQEADRLQARCSCTQMYAQDCVAIPRRWT